MTGELLNSSCFSFLPFNANCSNWLSHFFLSLSLYVCLLSPLCCRVSSLLPLYMTHPHNVRQPFFSKLPSWRRDNIITTIQPHNNNINHLHTILRTTNRTWMKRYIDFRASPTRNALYTCGPFILQHTLCPLHWFFFFFVFPPLDCLATPLRTHCVVCGELVMNLCSFFLSLRLLRILATKFSLLRYINCIK